MPREGTSWFHFVAQTLTIVLGSIFANEIRNKYHLLYCYFALVRAYRILPMISKLL